MTLKGKFRWGKWLFLLVLLGAAGAGGAWLLKRPQEEPIEYVTTTVASGELTQSVTATGTLNPVVNVQVGSQISGIILKLNADFNSKVKAGEIIAQLDPATYLATVHQNEGDVANAKASLQLAQINAGRATKLLKELLIPQADHDTALANLAQAEATVKIREAVLERSQVDLARCTIYAPIDGIVISRNVDVGQTVAASMSAPTLFVVAKDLTQMQIDANVSEADVGGVEDGQSVTFSVDAFPYRNFAGKVVQVRNSPITVQNVVSYDTVIEVSNPDLKLKPGMTANVSIITAQKPSCVRIPNAALRFRPPEPSTNQTMVAKLRLTLGLDKPLPAATNTVAAATGANTTNAAAPPAGDTAPKGRPPGGGLGKSRGQRSPTRTVYVLTATNAPAPGEPPPKPQAVQIKTGITDGIYTEVLDGLTEGALLVTGFNAPQTSGPAAAVNPFGGGMRFGR